MDKQIFQDDLQTANKIDSARQARERQINKGIMSAPLPSMSSDIEKAVNSQSLSEDVNGGSTDILFPEVEEYKNQLSSNNVTVSWIDLQLRNLQKQMIYAPNDAVMLQMKNVLLDKKEELISGEKTTLEGIRSAKKGKSILLSPDDIINGSKARDKAVASIIEKLKEEFGDIRSDLKDGVHRDGGILFYKDANIVWDNRHSEDVPLLVNIPSSFYSKYIQAIKERTVQLAKQYGMYALFGQRNVDAIIWISTQAYYDEDGNWHDVRAEQSIKKNK